MVRAMTDTDLLFTPAVQAAALIRTKKLSPVEYLDAVLKAAERANPKINCFREVMVEQARHDAKKAEEAVTRGEVLGPLHGVPISVKDLVDVEGVPTRHGSAIFEGNGPAAADDLLVQRLRKAGAVIFAKATTPEFGVKGLTDGPFGVTRNPWNLERTPGGSSGGGAAAVAAGLGPLSLGTDGALTFFNGATGQVYFSAAAALETGTLLPPYLAASVVTAAGDDKDERFFGLGQGGWTENDANGCPIGEQRVVPPPVRAWLASSRPWAPCPTTRRAMPTATISMPGRWRAP